MATTYGDYIESLDALLQTVAGESLTTDTAKAVESALSDGPMAALRRARTVEELRAGGTFFTSADLAFQLWERAIDEIDATSLIVDPAVGAGDLLLPVVAQLKALGTRHWAAQIAGFDVDDHFLDVARRRIRLSTGAPETYSITLANQDFLEEVPRQIKSATHVVMNPPFILINPSNDDRWGSGAVNAAAIFVERSLREMRKGARLLAILPEVLRSGSRYTAWREYIANQTESLYVKELGQFDANTDIHVFILDVTKTRGNGNPVTWPAAPHHSGPCVGDKFDVRVGAVVPHRHPDVGPVVAYATVGDIPSRAELSSIPGKRGFRGRRDRGPFVLVRRTSRPGDRHRAQASLYAGTEEVAVENHFLVLKPRVGGIDECRRLMDTLSTKTTTEHLDRTIRLRHLTVGSVGSIPLEDS